jgi:Fe2+ transport system protein FeoA
VPISPKAPELAAPAPVQLTSLTAGSVGRLHDTDLDDDTRSLLRSLGLTDASRLRVCKSGEPFIIQVRATRIGVSSAVARGIFVIPEAEATHAGHRSGR